MRARRALFSLWWICGISIFLETQTTSALEPQKPVTQYVHDAWRTEDGLPQNSVLAIAQTPDGYLWLATQEGLVRFDGVRFTVFDRNNTPAIRHSYIQTLFAARDGSLWIGTYGGGAVHLKDGRFTSYGSEAGLSNDHVLCINEDDDGSVWIGTDGGGLDRFLNGRFTVYGAKEGLANERVWAVRRDRRGDLWVGTDGGGLSRFADGRFSTVTNPEELPGGKVRSIFEGVDGDLWIGTFGSGLGHYKDGKFELYRPDTSLAHRTVRSVLEDRAGNLWVATFGGGLYRIKDGALSVFTTNDGLSDDFVISLCEDREGSLWIGSESGGLNRLRDGKLTAFTTKEGLSVNDVFPILEDREGSIWIGTRGGGLNRLKDGHFTAFTVKDGLSNDQVMSLCEDREGCLWIGTSGGGLNRLKNGRFTHYGVKDGLSSDIVWAICADRENRLWVGTEGGLNELSDGRFRTYGTQQGLSDSVVLSVQEDRLGSLWIGTRGGGLNQLKDGQIRTYTTRDGLSNNEVVCIYEDGEGALWIGTMGGGLNLLRGGKFASITKRDGLFDDTVWQVMEDSTGRLWMSSNKGIFSASKKEIHDFCDGKTRTIACVPYGTTDGMRSSECNGGFQPAGCKTRGGSFWFPTVRGAVLVDPGHIPINRLPPPVVIEELIADTRPYATAGTAMIGPGAKNFEFHYAGLSFLAPQKVLFRYMLEGFDKEWTEAGVRRTAYYTHLPPGNYRFRVVACNSDGVWNLAGAALDLSVKPHFYQTTLFYSLCILAFISAGPGAYLLRVRQMKARERVLEARVEEALANIRRLRGLLPICASCKSIRDDKGYWNQIESYIRDHSEADFSHSICPSCMKKLYPEFADQIASRSQQRELPRS